MAKSFMGMRLRTLREERGMTQAALAQALNLSPSYVNQIESNQRPLTVPVLLRVQAYFGIDLQLFSEDEESRVLAELREIAAGIDGPGTLPTSELQSVAQQLPGVARVMMALHRRLQSAEERVANLAAGTDGDRFAADHGLPLQPHEEVREFFYSRHNHMAVLDERAEILHERLLAAPARGANPASEEAGGDGRHPLTSLLVRLLRDEHGITTEFREPDSGNRQLVRSFDAKHRRLRISPTIEPGQQAFQLGIQAALLTVGPLIDSFIDAAAFTRAEARALARIGFANHFAGALLLPYRRFLGAAEELRYDIDLLSERFGVSFESVCHRLSTLQRAEARGIPFFFVRVDRAGNISKRQSATDFHFSRTGGTCPLWNVYEAFAQPGKVITQLSRMPDNRTYLWIARTVTHHRGGYGALHRTFAVALGCDVRYASRLVYAKGIALDDPEAATPIGAGCKVCDREECPQRAFPMLGRGLRINENVRQFSPYLGSSEGDGAPADRAPSQGRPRA
jgi:predicted transcriptional regulator/transcriptional regulator with XRE-family HTH domain